MGQVGKDTFYTTIQNRSPETGGRWTNCSAKKNSIGGIPVFSCLILIFFLLFLPQNEGITRSVSREFPKLNFLCQIYPHRVIHIVEKLFNKNYTLIINILRKLSTSGGKQSVVTGRFALLSLPLTAGYFTPPFLRIVPPRMSRFLKTAFKPLDEVSGLQ